MPVYLKFTHIIQVKGDVPDNVVIGGIPAKILKRLDPPPPVKDEEASQEKGAVLLSVP